MQTPPGPGGGVIHTSAARFPPAVSHARRL